MVEINTLRGMLEFNIKMQRGFRVSYKNYLEKETKMAAAVFAIF